MNKNELNGLDYFLMFMLVALFATSSLHIYYSIPQPEDQVAQ